MRSERPLMGSERPLKGSERPLRPLKGLSWGRGYVYMYAHTDGKFPHAVQDIVPFGAAAKKKGQDQKKMS